MSAFRSHLMQQFAAAARGQSRPPLALAPLYGAQQQSHSSTPRSKHPSGSPRRAAAAASSSTDTSTKAAPATVAQRSQLAGPRTAHTGSNRISDAKMGMPSISRRARSLSSISAVTENENDGNDTKSNAHLDLPQLFQHLIRTRRTISNLESPPNTSPPDFLSAAISRAVRCAIEAPNHKRTEPYAFTRLISPSAATEALADVCYHVSVRSMRELQKGSEATLLAEAERKRERWRSIPAYLVVTVGGMPDQEAFATDKEHDHMRTDGDREYIELPFVPPTTERQLEDYAATCAAVQNVLLSLHSENLGSKWATPCRVIRTKAFRDLINVQNDEFVVGLIMVGVPKRTPRSPRRQRSLEGDALRDL